MPPRTSLVLPVYNRADYIGEAVESVLRQSDSDWELIVWDDGSTDDSMAIVRDLTGRDERVRLIESEHRGLTRSLIEAFAAARGKYLGWLDSDDRLERRALEDTAHFLDRHAEVGLVYTQHRLIDARGKVLGLGRRCQIPYSRDQLLLDHITFHFRLMRRSVYEQVGGINPNYERAQDYDLCLRLSEVTEVHQIAKPLYDYRVHTGSVSQQQQLAQIDASRRAIEAALQRRDLDNQFRLEVELLPRFSLHRR